MGVCFDSTSGNDYLSLPEISQALGELPAIMDVVLMDACSMSMIEVAYQIKDYANVLVCPEGLGYAPPPYDQYLSSLTSNSSMLPSAFAKKVVTDYINWCNLVANIKNATMSAIDLTEIASLMTTIDDFAIKLKEKETLYHEQISLARNLTEGYRGPIASESGYYIDLYHFAQLTYQNVPDKELRDVANRVMAALSIGNTIIIADNKKLPNSHGLAIYFPNEMTKYEHGSYGTMYEKTTFAIDTSWDEFVKYDLSLRGLTIQTPYSGIQIQVGEDSYTTGADKKLQVFVLPNRCYVINVTTNVPSGSGSRGIFTQWKDEVASNPRTLFVSGTTTLEAEYMTQYQLAVHTDPLGLSPLPNIFPLGPWYNESEFVNCTAQEINGYTFDHWTFNGNDKGRDSSILVKIDTPGIVIAHYVRPPSWWENLLSTVDLKVILALVGLAVTGASVGTAWVRTRKRKSILKAMLDEIDKVYSEFKMNPRKCEGELCMLKNKILEELTHGRISEASHSIMEKRIEKYIEELRKQKRRKSADE
jgi:hypothetical protein